MQGSPPNIIFIQWDGKTLVIADLGISQPDGLGVSQISATPGFGAPEQVAGKAHKKSDNYSTGKVLGFLLSERNSGFYILYEPIDQNLAAEIAKFKNNDQFRCIFYDIMSGLLKVNIRSTRIQSFGIKG
jgi:serine/threonine protein kinase